ncbi:MAG: long-chain fatty acid transport protein, partial [Candidatus Hydrogenedentes bacterium]|nr:long-chain fatty acid transport protein [Candidatus Hydrogenedentota bacterium]
TPDLELALDYQFTNWRSVSFFREPPPHGGMGWEDEHIVKLGVEWRVDDHWTLHGGLSHGNSPVQPEHASTNGLTPIVTEDVMALGASYALSERSIVHATYTHAFYNEVASVWYGDIFSFLSTGMEAGLSYDALTVDYTYKF